MSRPPLPPLAQEARQQGRLISPSSIVKWRACRRRWSYQYVDKLPDPAGAAAALGTAVHALLERWLLRGVPPSEAGTKAGDIATRMLGTLPTHHQTEAIQLRVEEHFAFSMGTPGGKDWAVYHGFIDASWWEGSMKVVRDHKTSGNLQWAKTEDELAEDPQRIIYAHRFGRKMHDGTVRADWGYGCTAKPYTTRLVSFAETGNETAARMVTLHETDGLAIVAAYQQLTEEQPRTTSHCSAFGKPCPYMARCSPPKPSIGSLMSDTENPTLKKLRQKQAAKRKAAEEKAAAAAAAAPTQDSAEEKAPEEKAPEEKAPEEKAPEEKATAAAAPTQDSTEEKAPEEKATAAAAPTQDSAEEKADTRTNEEKAPRAKKAAKKATKKPRADVGKPRGGSLPDTFSNELKALIEVTAILEPLNNRERVLVLLLASQLTTD